MRKWLPLITVCLGTLMLLIDVTIVNVALPDMAVDLKTSFGDLQWVVDAYALTLAALVLGTGSIADLIGHRRAYIGGLVLFALSSFVCGIAPNAGALIGARAVQGVGAAAMFATTFALLNSAYTGKDRGIAYGMWGAIAGGSTAIGPVLGGLLTEGLSWRWIFFVNLPISVVAIGMTLYVLTDVAAPFAGRVDVPGIITFSGSAGAVTYALIRANEHGWATGGTYTLFAISAVLLAAFIGIELRTKHPMLDLSLMRNSAFVGVILAGMLMTFAAFTAFTYISIWMQSVLGMSPIKAGLVGLPMSIAAFFTSAALGRVLGSSRPGPLIATGLVLVGAGSGLSGLLLHGSASWPALIPGLIIIGLGVGLAMPTLSAAAMASVRPERGGMAAGALNTFRQLGFAFGTAMLGTVFAVRAQDALADRGVAGAQGVSRALAGGQAPHLLASVPADQRAALDATLHHAAIAGVRGALLVAAVVGIVAGVLVFFLVRTPAPNPGAPAGKPSDGGHGAHEAGDDPADAANGIVPGPRSDRPRHGEPDPIAI